MRKLKLVGVKTYVGPRSKDVILHKGDTLDCDDDVADALLKETYTDALNNTHPLFSEVEVAAPAPVRVSRQRKAVPA